MGVKVAPVDSTTVVLAAMALAAVYYVYQDGKKAAEAVVTAINPVDQDNVANQVFNGVTQAVTGDDSFSFGAWLAGVLNPPEKYEQQTLEKMGYQQ